LESCHYLQGLTLIACGQASFILGESYSHRWEPPLRQNSWLQEVTPFASATLVGQADPVGVWM